MSLREKLEDIEKQSRGNSYCPMYIPRDKVVGEILAAIAGEVERIKNPYEAFPHDVGSQQEAWAKCIANIVEQLKGRL